MSGPASTSVTSSSSSSSEYLKLWRRARRSTQRNRTTEPQNWTQSLAYKHLSGHPSFPAYQSVVLKTEGLKLENEVLDLTLQLDEFGYERAQWSGVASAVVGKDDAAGVLDSPTFMRVPIVRPGCLSAIMNLDESFPMTPPNLVPPPRLLRLGLHPSLRINENVVLALSLPAGGAMDDKAYWRGVDPVGKGRDDAG
ncbi:hypothetical protein FA15DRAFT_661249 [Coprinopsis marcescibilis]|uniref:Uncharacterized protein n=1 Tax=Coprinopsis marcescibilis TaxID=230819 RepID=A0A5C3KC89_COPMA|nr:hypothetical protein FA15DRAFT_661249 [Coprinopsis marcescibilis]